MSNREYTQEIYAQEAVGDSLGKINYNILNLEQKLSQFSFLKNFTPEVLVDIDQKFTLLNNIKEQFINNKRLSQCISTAKALKTHWNNKNIQVLFPFNLSEIWDDPELRCVTNNDSFGDVCLKLKKILYLKYHPSSYPKDTLIHFVVPIHNIPVASPDEEYSVNSKHKSSNVDIEVSNPFSYEQREQTVKITKKSQHISQFQTFIFKNVLQKRWVLTNHLSSQRFQSKVQRSSVTSERVTLNISIDKTTYNYDLYDDIMSNYSTEYSPGNTDIVLKITEKGLIGSTSPLHPSLSIRNFNITDTVKIQNFGSIYGAGGNGKDGQNAYSSPITDKYIDFRPETYDGGTALLALCSVTVENYGRIYGGGGGGAGGVSADTTVPPLTSISVFDPEIEDLWCCYKYDIAKSRYETDLADGVIEYIPEKIKIKDTVPTYSAGGGGGGGQGFNGGLAGKCGSLIPLTLKQTQTIIDATDGSAQSPGAGGLGLINSDTTLKPDQGGNGGGFGQNGDSSYVSSEIGGFAGYSCAGKNNIVFDARGDLRGELI